MEGWEERERKEVKEKVSNKQVKNQNNETTVWKI
jgi:hypothetical protein